MRGTLQTYVKWIQRTARVGTVIFGSHNVLFHVGFEPTTLVAVESGVATAQTSRPTVQ